MHESNIVKPMRAMVMAAGLGTRLRPITWEIPKPVVPVGNVAIVEHLVHALAAQGAPEIIANLHWFPDTVKKRLGDGSNHGAEITYSFEEELLGTAGGVRNVADFLTGGDDDVFVVVAGDALTDIDLKALVADHRANGGAATLAVKRVDDVSQFGVIIVDGEDRVQGFQEKPDPAEALSDRVNCMVYAFSAEIFDYFPDDPAPDFAHDVFPLLLENDVAFHVHEVAGYWNDIGTLPEYLQGNLDAVEGTVVLDSLAGELLDGSGEAEGFGSEVEVEGKVLVGAGATVGDGAALKGPMVIGPGANVGAGSRVTESLLLPGAEIAERSVVARAILGGAEQLVSGDW